MDEFKINFDGTEIPIPTKTSQLENDSQFATQSDVESSASSTLDSANAYTDNKFNGANKAVSFVNYSSMITSLNTLSNTSYSVGQNIMIVTLEVPDLWVSEVAETSVAYTYVSDDVFVADLNTNGSVQVGYYKLSALETQKVDLTEYVKNTDYATASKAGLIRANSSQGLFISETGDLSLVQAQPTDLVNKTNKFRPLTANNMDEAFKVSITTNTIELTDEEKASTQAWLGVPSVERVNEVEADIPTKTSDLTNDSAFITANDIPASDVTSVNGKTGAVELSAGDVNALPDTTKIPSKTSDLTNDSGFITGESDPTVPSWAKQASKPTYTYSEITEKPTLATVATSGNYNDLSNKPAIPDVSGKADLNNANQTITANDIVLQGFSMFNYCADLGSKITPIKFLSGGDISSNTYLPVIDVGQMGIVSYRSTTNTTLKLYLPSSGSYDYALILGNPYHSSGGTGVSNGISGTNTAGGSHLTDIVNNSKYTAVMVLYRRVS